MQLTRKIY